MVRPEWIVDSIKAQTLLSEEDYLLERLRGGPAQKTIHAFKAVTAQALEDDVIYPAARPTLGRLQQQQQQAQQRQMDDKQQHRRTLQMQSAEIAEPSPLHDKPPAAGAVNAMEAREPSGNPGEDDDAEAFSFMATSSAVPGKQAGGADASGDPAQMAEQGGGLICVHGPPVASACLPTEQRQQAVNEDAASQYGSGDPEPELQPRRPAAAPTWTAEDLRVAQAAAAAARSRCDMLKVCALCQAVPAVVRRTRLCRNSSSCLCRALQSRRATTLTM